MKLKRKDLRKLINEMVSVLDKIEKPGSGNMTNSDRYELSGSGMGYSPVQDMDKLVSDFLTTTASVINPTFGAYAVGVKTINEVLRDTSELYEKDKTKDKANFKKQLKKYVVESGIDTAIGKLPAGKYLQKIPGYNALNSTGKEVAKSIFKEIEGVIQQKSADIMKSEI